MKKFTHPPAITFLFVIAFSLLSLSVNSQIPQCVYPKIKGPLLVCNSATTSHYYVKPIGNYINVNWSVYPSTAGTKFNATQFTTDVTWSATAIIDHGYLVYSCDGYSDTLFPQACCTSVPLGVKKIRDLDDAIGTPNGGDKVADAFNDPSQPSLNVQHTAGTDIVKVTDGVYFIEGQLNLEVTRVEFIGCTFYMGSGAVIYAPRGYLPGAGLLGDFVARDNTHFLGTPCGMWQGIFATGDSKLYFSNSTIEDAEYAVKFGGCILAITCDQTTFNNNVITVFSQHIVSPSSNVFYNLGPDDSRFRNCIFDSSTPMVLPKFNGQRALPGNQKPFAAMYFNDLVQGVTNGLKSIPFDENPVASCIIQNMPFGIYGVNSQLDVFNCRFINIQAPVGSSLGKIPNTAAIYSTVKTGSAPNQLNVGDDDIPGVSNLHNEFTDCYFGVRSQGNVNSKILYNIFKHDINVTNQTPSGRAIMLRDANNATIKVNHNNIIDHKIVSIPGSFNSTGIFISNSGQFNQNLEILSNSIDNNRIGIYLSNIKGNNLTPPDFHVAYNLINSTIPENQLIGTHFGMFLSKIDKALIEANTISRSQTLSTSPNFQTKMYGMNNVSCTNSIIAANYFHQYGTSMRYVGPSGGTELHCNTMDNCIQGVYLANASMSTQGDATNSIPWDNKWDGFPTPSTTTYNRVDGVQSPLVVWYNRGLPNTQVTNNFSPEPVNTTKINPIPLPNYNDPSCQSGGSNSSSFQHLLDIVTSNISYPAYPNEERYNDEEYVYQTLLRDSALIASENDFQQFLLEYANTNRDYFHQVEEYIDNGNLSEAANLLNLIIDTNVIEHNKHFSKSIALRLLQDPEALVTEAETEELENIAWTNAWEGGNGVFTARHVLDEEVFDAERNLKIGRHIFNTERKVNISVYPNPVINEAIIYHDWEEGSSLKLIVNDYTGRPVMATTLRNNIVDVSKLQGGIYTFSFYCNGVFNSTAKISVLK